jgi:hypothetical protein
VSGKELKGFRYRLIPVFSDAIRPDAEMAALVKKHREPFERDLSRVLGKTDGLLYRRGNFQGSLDDVFTDAMLQVRDAEIALSPGVRWGASLLPGQDITFEDVTNACAMTYPNCYRMGMRGDMLKTVLEDVADNIFNPDPYLQGGGDMVRVGGIGFTIDEDDRKPHLRPDAAADGAADRRLARVHDRRLGLDQRGHARPSYLGGREPTPDREEGRHAAPAQCGEGRRNLTMGAAMRSPEFFIPTRGAKRSLGP